MFSNLSTYELVWIGIGFAGQFLFFLRFMIQWLASEKKGESVIPVSFWYLGIAASLLLLLYSLHRKDIVFIVALFLNSLIYLRNIVLINNKKLKKKME